MHAESFRTTWITSGVVLCVWLATVLFDLDAAEAVTAFLRSAERFELDELLLALPVIAVAAWVDASRFARNAAVQAASVSATHEARARLAMELHDDVGQQLTGMSLLVSAAAAQAADPDLPEDFRASMSEQLGAVVQLASEVSAKIRGLHQWTPPDWLAGLGVLGACAELVEQAGNLYRVKAQLVTAGADHVSAAVNNLPASATEHIYRIAQEAINNAVRHGGASAVEIRFEQVGSAALIEIWNNGTGFDANDHSPTKGMGLGNIRYRAQALGAKLEWLTANTGNVRIRLLVP